MQIEVNEKEVKKEKKMVAFEISQDWYDVLKLVADEEMISVSTLIRKVIYKNCLAEKIAKLNDGKGEF